MQDITSFMKDLDERYRNASGLRERRFYSIFYSQIVASKLLVLGYNPGGDPESWDESQLASTTFYEGGEHEYVDCHYKIANAMREFLQTVLGLSSYDAIRSIPKTNLIFRRSVGQNSLTSDQDEAIRESLPFLEEIISRVNPKVILLEGTTTLDKFEEYYCTDVSSKTDGPVIRTPNGRNMARIYQADIAEVSCLEKPVTLIGIGHPSKFSGRKEWREVTSRTRKALTKYNVAA